MPTKLKKKSPFLCGFAPLERYRLPLSERKAPVLMGFTLIEMLVAIAAMILLVVLVASGLASFRRSSDLEQATNETLELLREARAKALGSENEVEYSVHFASTTITLFSGGNYNPAAPGNIVVKLPTSVVVSATALSTTTNNVTFERLTGESKAVGTVTLGNISVPANQRVIQILPSGLFLQQ